MVTVTVNGMDDRAGFEERLRGWLGEIFGANPWVIAAEVEQGAVRLAHQVKVAGDQPVLAVGARPGVGALDNGIPLISLDLPDAGSMLANMYSAQAALADPPNEVRAAVDAWDPVGAARVVGGLTATEGQLFGRPLFGARPEEWLALEDKLLIESLWAAAGIEVARSAQVDAGDAERLLVTHRDLDSGLGTVWAVDNSKGWHGGGQGTFWVPDERAVDALTPKLDGYQKVRVMPFLDGVPCSIHGMVMPSSGGQPVPVAAFRPCEMMMFRAPALGRFVYGRISNYWDPKPQDRAAMQDVVRRIGTELHRTVGFRGVFTVDGIMTVDGFRPTEVNTRYGAALTSEMRTESGPPIELYHVHLALVEGLLEDLTLEPFQEWVVGNLDEARRAVGFLGVDRCPVADRSARLGRTTNGTLIATETTGEPSEDTGADTDTGADSAAHTGADSDPPVAEVTWGRGPNGGLLLVRFDAGVEVGAMVAPILLEVGAAVDRLWGVGIAELVPANAVR